MIVETLFVTCVIFCVIGAILAWSYEENRIIAGIIFIVIGAIIGFVALGFDFVLNPIPTC